MTGHAFLVLPQWLEGQMTPEDRQFTEGMVIQQAAAAPGAVAWSLVNGAWVVEAWRDCRYVTSLGRECGRPATTGKHCDFHAVLAQLDDYDFRNPTPITVPASVRPLVDRILSDVTAHLETRPWKVCP